MGEFMLPNIIVKKNDKTYHKFTGYLKIHQI